MKVTSMVLTKNLKKSPAKDLKILSSQRKPKRFHNSINHNWNSYSTTPLILGFIFFTYWSWISSPSKWTKFHHSLYSCRTNQQISRNIPHRLRWIEGNSRHIIRERSSKNSEIRCDKPSIVSGFIDCWRHLTLNVFLYFSDFYGKFAVSHEMEIISPQSMINFIWRFIWKFIKNQCNLKLHCKKKTKQIQCKLFWLMEFHQLKQLRYEDQHK